MILVQFSAGALGTFSSFLSTERLCGKIVSVKWLRVGGGYRWSPFCAEANSHFAPSPTSCRHGMFTLSRTFNISHRFAVNGRQLLLHDCSEDSITNGEQALTIVTGSTVSVYEDPGLEVTARGGLSRFDTEQNYEIGGANSTTECFEALLYSIIHSFFHSSLNGALSSSNYIRSNDKMIRLVNNKFERIWKKRS
jgi:hypothetical protein